jgi:C4-dicarboxylate transporter, DctM subunit
VILVIYAVYTEQSIGALFIAAVVPGILATIGYMIVVNIYVRLVPGAANPVDRAPWSERLASTRDVWPAALVFGLVVIGIYRGWFSPTEAAAIGAAAVLVIAVVLGGMRWQGFYQSLLSTAETTALMYIVLLGAELFSAALAITQMPTELSRYVAGLNMAPLTIIAAILVIYLILGCFMESLAMVLLTLPVFIPLILSLDLGMTQGQVLIWFGILVLVSVEVGMISPPFGLNLFVINAMAKDVPMVETYKGVVGFCISDVIRLVLLVAFPALSLWLPGVK